jgi:hypothetical protein
MTAEVPEAPVDDKARSFLKKLAVAALVLLTTLAAVLSINEAAKYKKQKALEAVYDDFEKTTIAALERDGFKAKGHCHAAFPNPKLHENDNVIMFFEGTPVRNDSIFNVSAQRLSTDDKGGYKDVISTPVFNGHMYSKMFGK